MKYINKFMRISKMSVLAILSIFLLFVVTSCESKKNEFTIRVFDSGTNEEKKETKRYYYDYTGSPVSFEIKVYCNDKLIHETTLEYILGNEGPGSLITVRGSYLECNDDACKEKTGDIHPIEKGWYSYNIEFNRMYRWEDEIIQNHILNDFFLTFFIDYDYYMSTKEEN